MPPRTPRSSGGILPRPEPATLAAHNRLKTQNALIADSERNMPRSKKSKRRQTLCKESRARQILDQGGEHYSKNHERRHVRRKRSEKNQELWLTLLTRGKLDYLLERRHGRMNQINQNESNTRAIRALFGKSSHGTHRLPAVAAAVVPEEVARARLEVEAPRAAGKVRIRRR